MTASHLTERKRPPTTVDVAVIELGLGDGYTWRVVSDCGVVKLYSSRDGCMLALDPSRARDLARELEAAVNEAADLTEIRSFGKVVSR